MRIRQEGPRDYSEVFALVKQAFSTGIYDGEGEYLDAVRKKETFIPELSLVAKSNDGQLVGQIVLYQTQITTLHGVYTELLLSPISVRPDYFRQVIAKAMMEQSFSIAKRMGYTAVFLCGEPEFYRKRGFQPSYQFGICHINDETQCADWCMALELASGALAGKAGTIDIV